MYRIVSDDNNVYESLSRHDLIILNDALIEWIESNEATRSKEAYDDLDPEMSIEDMICTLQAHQKKLTDLENLRKKLINCL